MDHKTLDARLEIKFVSTDATDKSFTGYGAFFNNVDAYGDVIAPGAFTKTLADLAASATAPAMLWNHDGKAMPIGIWTDLAEDASGLKVSGVFLDTVSGSDAYKLAKSGAVSGLSIGYFVTGFEMSTVNGRSIRTITELTLFEISLVTFPANDLARVQSVKTEEINVTDIELKTVLEAIAEVKADLEALRAEHKAAAESKDIDDDQYCDCDPDDEDCDCDDEDKSETKYNTAFIAAVNNLTRKLAKENHGR